MTKPTNPPEIRLGDLVAVTARITGLDTGNGYSIEPMGFDFDVEPAGSDVDVHMFTVDDPTFLRHALMRGDVKYSVHGIEKFTYHMDLGEGLHLLRDNTFRSSIKNHWVTMTTQEVFELSDDNPRQ